MLACSVLMRAAGDFALLPHDRLQMARAREHALGRARASGAVARRQRVRVRRLLLAAGHDDLDRLSSTGTRSSLASDALLYTSTSTGMALDRPQGLTKIHSATAFSSYRAMGGVLR